VLADSWDVNGNVIHRNDDVSSHVFTFYRMDSFMTASTNVVSTGIGGENFNLTSITDLVTKHNSENYFEEESNFHMLGDLSIFILNSSIFMLQSIQLSKYTSDIM
jgi:hypothetical protein